MAQLANPLARPDVSTETRQPATTTHRLTQEADGLTTGMCPSFRLHTHVATASLPCCCSTS